MHYKILSIFSAYFLDLALGDPQLDWHPVRIIGRLIGALEKRLNTDKFNRKISGLILVILVVSILVFCVWLILKFTKLIHPIFYYIASIILIYFGLSVRALAVEADKVRNALMNKNIQGAREDLSMIVGRDTDTLDEPGVIRATIETLAESIMDGVVAPLFYCFLGGPVLLWLYKTVNTLDSMVGYRSARFIDFGWASAQLDGLLNFIPSRITCFLIAVSSFFMRRHGFNSIKWGYKHLLKGPAFNSQATEAAMAGALGVRLGGINFYKSSIVTNPFIGENLYPLQIKHIQESISIVYLSSILTLGFGIILWYRKV